MYSLISSFLGWTVHSCLTTFMIGKNKTANPRTKYSSDLHLIFLLNQCISCPQFCPHLPTFSGFLARFSFFLVFLIGSVMRFVRFRNCWFGIVIVQMIPQQPRNHASDIPHNKAVRRLTPFTNPPENLYLPTLLPTITLRNRAKQKGMQRKNCIPYRILSSDGFLCIPAKWSEKSLIDHRFFRNFLP